MGLHFLLFWATFALAATARGGAAMESHPEMPVPHSCFLPTLLSAELVPLVDAYIIAAVQATNTLLQVRHSSLAQPRVADIGLS